jgi:hypothetical protein
MSCEAKEKKYEKDFGSGRTFDWHAFHFSECFGAASENQDSKAETTAGANGKRATGGGQRNATISAAA